MSGKIKLTFLYTANYHKTGIPIGLSYLIAILRNRGNEVSLFETTFYKFNYTDFNITKRVDENGRKIIDDFKNFINKNNPDLICVSSCSLCLDFAVEMLKSLEKRPKTIFGGVGATVDYTNLIKKEIVDYVCVGFGEDCLPGLVAGLEEDKDPGIVPNLVYKKGKEIIINKFSQSVDLSKMPIPDWSLFDKRHFERIFKGDLKRWGNFQLTRGCPFSCSYCINAYYHAELKMKIYKLQVEAIIKEIELLSDKYRLDIIRIFDECFGFGDLKRYREFANLYKKRIGLPTIIETRPEAVRPEIIAILKDMNCISVSMGIEAGDEAQRRTMLNRKVSNAVIKKAFDLLRESKIRASSYNIVGFPHDTREKIFETIKFNRKCRPDFVNVFIFCPDPKTQLREYCLKKGLLDTNAIGDYGEKSLVKNENMNKDELYGLYRTFECYVRFPEYLYPLIKRAERFDSAGNTIFKLLNKVKQTVWV